MIIGSGLLAHAFAPYFDISETQCVYAAGVSNSMCDDRHKIDREKARLADAIHRYAPADVFLYFGICSVNGAATPLSPYLAHKIEMERLAQTHARHLILRLPQVAGRSENPHTLLNYIFNRVSRSERFQAWSRARRNVIDVDDAARMAVRVVQQGIRGEKVDVANPSDASMTELVQTMARVVGKPAICDYVDRGDACMVDVESVRGLAERCGIGCDETYLARVLEKYYGSAARSAAGGSALAL